MVKTWPYIKVLPKFSYFDSTFCFLFFNFIQFFIYFIFLERPRSPWEVHAEPLGLRGAQVGNLWSKPLAAWRGRGTAWARHDMCESAYWLLSSIWYIRFLPQMVNDSTRSLKLPQQWVMWGCCHEAVRTAFFWFFNAACGCNSSPTFRENLSAPSSRVKNPL